MPSKTPEPPDGPRWTGLSESPLPVAAVHDFLRDDRAGGVCVFVGAARRWTGAAETDLLTYEAYGPMAEAELVRLAEAAEARWPVVRLAALHRTGAVAPPESAVVVGVACPHRAEAFAACRWIIDTLKAEVPIWKTEHPPASTDSP